jgi:Cdc6-like AAA superfamily ATPase
MEELHSWSTDTSTESTILWLHGCAGAGKSAIAQMFAKSLQNEGRLGTSFFFQRGHLKRGTWHSLILTIAYQLATSMTELLLLIQQAVEGDKLIVGRALAISFQALLVEPLTKLSNLQRTPVIVLDGLDECADYKI